MENIQAGLMIGLSVFCFTLGMFLLLESSRIGNHGIHILDFRMNHEYSLITNYG